MPTPLPHRSSRARRLAMVVCAAIGLGWAMGAAAQDAYPSKPLRFIVPFAAGGSADVEARLFANGLAEVLGQPVVVDNKGGAASILGTDMGAKAKPDGYTLTMTNGAAITTGPIIGQRIAYRPIEDFVHLFLIGTFPNLLVVRSEFPARNLTEFLAVARKSSSEGKGLSWGSAGVGSAGHLAGMQLQHLSNTLMVHVPYKGTGPAFNDLLGGQLDAMLTSPAVAGAQIKAGKIRAIAVSSAKRLDDYPDVPTMDETVPGAIGDAWFGVAVPAGTPAPVVDKLEAAMVKTLARPQLRSQLHEAGMVPLGLQRPAMDAFLRDEVTKWTPVIRAANIKPE